MDFEQICHLAGVQRKKTDKGIEIFCGKKKVGTFLVEEGVTRFKYPKGHEYRHTSYWGRKLDDKLVLDTMVGLALEAIREERQKILGS